jgi:2-oxoacid:acceptor oxidoreductase gamma subunit (pyruvate/2-ketoisovalerate family)
MHEIRFHGRGGQGTVVASILLAKAFFNAGYYVQSFPVFGVERRGAPVEAYLRLDKKKILIRSNVYTPDHVVVQDAKLLGNVDVVKGLKPGGSILINSKDTPDNLAHFSGFRLAFVDANHIAVKNNLGTRTHPIINTAMIGAANGGVRTFTATSSQGLALMHELLHWASAGRLPIVMAEVNRALAPGGTYGWIRQTVWPSAIPGGSSFTVRTDRMYSTPPFKRLGWPR